MKWTWYICSLFKLRKLCAKQKYFYFLSFPVFDLNLISASNWIRTYNFVLLFMNFVSLLHRFIQLHLDKYSIYILSWLSKVSIQVLNAMGIIWHGMGKQPFLVWDPIDTRIWIVVWNNRNPIFSQLYLTYMHNFITNLIVILL